MVRYEDGLPPVSPMQQHDEQEEVKHEGQIVKFVLEVPKSVYEEFVERILKKEYPTISRHTMQYEIVQSIRLRIRLDDQLNPPGTTIVRKLPDGSEQQIHPVI